MMLVWFVRLVGNVVYVLFVPFLFGEPFRQASLIKFYHVGHDKPDFLSELWRE